MRNPRLHLGEMRRDLDRFADHEWVARRERVAVVVGSKAFQTASSHLGSFSHVD